MEGAFPPLDAAVSGLIALIDVYDVRTNYPFSRSDT